MTKMTISTFTCPAIGRRSSKSWRPGQSLRARRYSSCTGVLSRLVLSSNNRAIRGLCPRVARKKGDSVAEEKHVSLMIFACSTAHKLRQEIYYVTLNVLKSKLKMPPCRCYGPGRNFSGLVVRKYNKLLVCTARKAL